MTLNDQTPPTIEAKTRNDPPPITTAGVDRVIMVHDWSDDFEPNYSIKSNRGSVWVRTVTFAGGSIQHGTHTDTRPDATARQ